MRAYIVLVTADLPAMAKLMGMKGVNAYSYCRFCKIQGTWCPRRRHIYCPLKTPSTTIENPNEENQTPVPEGAGEDILPEDVILSQDERLHVHVRVYNPRNLSLRNDSEFRRHAAEVCATNNTELGKVYGINYLPALAELPSLYFPRSFPVDIMHLLFEGLSPLMLAHWTGEFFSAAPLPPTDPVDDYILSKKDWDDIGKDLADSRATFPSNFGRAPRDIKFRKSFKASEHMNWLTIFSPIVLQDRLPQYHYDE